MRPRSAALLAASSALALVPLLSACGTTAAAALPNPSVPTASQPVLPDHLALPAAKSVVLTVKGGSLHNAGSELRLSIAELEALPTVDVSVYEPFVKRRVVFHGVRLETLLALARLPRSVATLHAVALNDYAVDIPISVTGSPGTILATRADGKLIAVKDGGPTRIVFTDDHPSTHDESLWIWSLASLAPR